MKFSFMRRADNLLGTPLCVALGLAEKALGLVTSPPKVPAPDSVRGVLVIKFLGVGSVVEATPVFRLLRSKYPRARIAFLTFDSCAGIARLGQAFDEIRSISTASFPAFVAGSLSAILWGWRRGFDVSYDFEFFSKFSYVMSYLIHARVRVGYFIRVLRYVNLLTHSVPYNAHRHVSEAFAAQLDSGEGKLVPPALERPSLPVEAEREAARLLEESGLTAESCLVAMNVNASSLSTLRLWPAEYWARLAEMLHDSFQAAIVFIGTGGDRARTEDVTRLIPAKVRAVSLAGKTSLEGVCALLSRARLLVSCDSGPLHLGAMMGTPTVSFFGAESASVYGPRGESSVNLDHRLYCSPCLNVYNFKEFDCPYSVRCLSEIGPGEAFAAASRLLGQTRS